MPKKDFDLDDAEDYLENAISALENADLLERRNVKSLPGFVWKLYRMVSDSSNNLIRWSDAGDSFIIADADFFSKEILPKYCKHNNFSSFVRQLNMYGFHKIPHLHGGIAGEDADLWEFSNANFVRGKPELLVHVKRKLAKNGASSTITSTVPYTAPNFAHITAASASAFAVAATNGALGNAANSHTAAIAAENAFTFVAIQGELEKIRKQQETIANDLRTLQTENQLLWSENFASRERFKQQQATINKILHFLATVFTSKMPQKRVIQSEDAKKSLSSSSPPVTQPEKAAAAASLAEILDSPVKSTADPGDIDPQLFELIQNSSLAPLVSGFKWPTAAEVAAHKPNASPARASRIGEQCENVTVDLDMLQEDLNVLHDSLGLRSEDFGFLGAIPDSDIEFWKSNYDTAIRPDQLMTFADDTAADPLPVEMPLDDADVVDIENLLRQNGASK